MEEDVRTCSPWLRSGLKCKAQTCICAKLRGNEHMKKEGEVYIYAWELGYIPTG